MATSIPAQEESAQPPSTDSPLPVDSRNDSVAIDESAPLLDSDDRAPPTQNASNKILRIFTSIALSSSALTLIFIIAANIALKVGNDYYGLPWSVSDSMRIIIAPAVFSLLFSMYNLVQLRNGLGVPSLAINLLCDILVAVFAISYGGDGLSGIDRGPVTPAKVLAGIALAIGIICGIAHMGLFVLRCRLAYRSEFWRHPWGFPTGQLTVEFSVKLYREPQRPRETGESQV
ncbi:hypothetical protein JMJ35_003998 [Cladonia borealis]|uniref:Uncharacterized protein n=1 Tax=Cladonia borealis TaxID=184061 RepID=A0AA39R4R9_9LECA|nr:hypothetical protein JMJ35_003998 [Cladonia borealis]